MMQLLYNIVFDAIPIITSQGKVITGYAGQGLTLKKKGSKLLVNSWSHRPINALTRQSRLCREGVQWVCTHILLSHGLLNSIYLIPVIQKKVKNGP